MLLGAHVSSAGGLSQALVRGQELGISCIQTFASSPRTIHFSKISDTEISKYRTYKEASGVNFHVFHGVYLINLAHSNPEYVDLCIKSLVEYQNVAHAIGGFGTVFHVGSHKGRGLDVCCEAVSHAIGHVTQAMPKDVWLLLEVAAGQNGAIGQNLAELAQIITTVASLGYPTDHLGVGLDTQHAFASGYDLRVATGLEQLVSDIVATVGVEKIQLAHVNDSLTEFNSRRDRHANIGTGLIGSNGLASFVNHPKLKHLPFILEVPGRNKSGPTLDDVKALKSLVV